MDNLKIKFKKMNPNAVIPKRGTIGAAGFDLTAIGLEVTETTLKFDTGIAVEIPPGYVGLAFPRSSVCKTGLQLANSVGVIDSDYRGSISFVFYKGPTWIEPYSYGDRIGQLVIMPIPEVEFVEAEELSETERGEGGYGSTGK